MHCIDGLSPAGGWQGSLNISQDDDDSTFTGIELISRRITYTPDYPLHLLKETASQFALLGHNPSEFAPLCNRVAQLNDEQLDAEFVPLLLPFVVAMQLAPERSQLHYLFMSLDRGDNENYLSRCVRERYKYVRDGRITWLDTTLLVKLHQKMATLRGQIKPANYEKMSKKWRQFEFQELVANKVVENWNRGLVQDESNVIWGAGAGGLAILGFAALTTLPADLIIGGSCLLFFGAWKGKTIIDGFVENWLKNNTPLLASQQATTTPLLKSRYHFYQHSTKLGGRLLRHDSKSAGVLQVGEGLQIPFKASLDAPFPISAEHLIVLRSMLLQQLNKGPLTIQECQNELIPYTATPLVNNGKVLVPALISAHEVHKYVTPLLSHHPSEVGNWKLTKEKIP